MSVSPPRRLPRGRNALSRQEVERVQRDRLIGALADVMSEKGFVATSVEDVLKRAAVSRQSFYQLFSSKLDCFMAAFNLGVGLLEDLLAATTKDAEKDVERDGGTDPLARFEQFVGGYLETLAAGPAYARLFIVEVYAAGPVAIARRIEFQRLLADALADLFAVETEAGRFACQVIISATSTMVTGPLVADDLTALRAVGPPLIEHVRLLWESGVFSRPASGH
jgi:AcrR family transcriptional regulator